MTFSSRLRGIDSVRSMSIETRSCVRTRPDHVIRFSPIIRSGFLRSLDRIILLRLWLAEKHGRRVSGRFAEGLQDHRRRSEGVSYEGRRDHRRCSWGWLVGQDLTSLSKMAARLSGKKEKEATAGEVLQGHYPQYYRDSCPVSYLSNSCRAVCLNPVS